MPDPMKRQRVIWEVEPSLASSYAQYDDFLTLSNIEDVVISLKTMITNPFIVSSVSSLESWAVPPDEWVYEDPEEI
jgi:hypothetical protein